MGLELHHGRCAGKHIVTDEILADNDDLYARRAYVLLNAGVNQAVLCNIHGLRKEAGRNIGYQILALGVGKGVELGTVDGVVLADVHIIHVIGYGQIRAVGDVGKGLVCRGGKLNCLSVDLCLCKGLLCPLSGKDVTRLFIFHEVHGNGRENK